MPDIIWSWHVHIQIHENLIVILPYTVYTVKLRCTDILIHAFVCLLQVIMHFLCGCLGIYASPGQNYKEIGFLLVLGKICMSKKRIKRIDPQNNAQAGPECSQHALHIKHIHLYCTATESFENENNFFAEKELGAIFGSLFSLHQLPANCFWWQKLLKLNYYRIKPSPAFDCVYDKWLIMVISEIEHWVLLCAPN